MTQEDPVPLEPETAEAAVEAAYRRDWGLIVATLIRMTGDFDLAEEAAQQAFATAVRHWRAAGIPEIPRAWLIQTARHTALDWIRRRARAREILDSHRALWFNRTVAEPDYNPK